MCQPACRGGNKRSRNTSNPTLICPYRSTMGTQNFAQRTPPARSQTPMSVADVVLNSLNYQILKNTRRIALRIS
ncbi:hypothetical protein GBF38_007020 [Nibea albiflora]|uniref:Uncharacterized protein n=1 Tax=Nibea albiflora TaxID=240163 RepID=A0ACB7EH04_NIBAL|nr:hypothetical protein GBF38_007020 [Nibea albiflora]